MPPISEKNVIMSLYKFCFSFICIAVVVSCSEKPEGQLTLIVNNSLSLDRTFETVELTKEILGFKGNENLAHYEIQDAESRFPVTSQVIDTDRDGYPDVLIFQPKVKAKSKKKYNIVKLAASPLVESNPACYSRFVPERTDDYAWENNKVAFRTYGPQAQKMKEEGTPGGTLSSGIDAWLKKVEYPIINAWYEKNTSGTGSYHEDTGEGLDNFHVGASRGIGGIAIKADSAYYFSKNFTTWETITTGPIRTSFVLTYAGWDAGNKKINEEKHISLDYGSNLSKFVIYLTGTDVATTGLTLHDKKGEVKVNEEKGWLRYWEPIDDSEIGSGIVIPNKMMVGYNHFITEEADLSNLYADIKVENKKMEYYAGFAWKKSGQYPTVEAWDAYLQDFAEKVNAPMTIEVK